MAVTRPQDRKKPTRHARDRFHAWMLEDAGFLGDLDMPVLEPVHANPKRLIAFSDAMSPKCKDFDQVVHFFEDDDIIERFWSEPFKYTKKLSRFEGVVGLDFSVCWDFPVALKHYNYYRNNTCTYWMQKVFKLAIPQARCEESNFMNVLAGHPMHSTIAIGARGMVKNKKDREMLKKSVKLIVDFLQPSNILWYGSTLYGVTDYIIEMGIPTTVYPGKGKGSLSHHGNEGAA